jgi:outer membrane protein assembly factor BamB
LRNRLFCVSILLCGFAISNLDAAESTNRYRAAAQKYADALLAYGRDHYGPIQTPLFVQIIDLRTLEIPKQRTAAEWRAEMSHWKEDSNYLMWGKDRSSMLWAQDSNLLWDTENVRLLNALSVETGDSKYARAADEYMRFFLKCCVSHTTGLFAWGEHMAYNVQDDEIHGQRHELQHPAPLWDELWTIDPEAVRGEIEGVYNYHITDKRIMAYDRHANYWNGLPERDQATILLYAGIYIDSFAFLFEKTHDAKYDEWARKLLLAFESKSSAEGLYPDNWTDHQKREEAYPFPIRPELAVAMYIAFQRTHDQRWLDDANRYLEACDRSFQSGSATGDDLAMGPMRFARAALLAYRFTGRREYLDMANRYGADLLNRQQPHAQMASSLAGSIDTLGEFYESTGGQQWLEGAKKLGDFALRTFVRPSGLIVGTATVDRPDYYDTIQGSGALALALYKLGMLLEPAQPLHPQSREGDVTAPTFGDLQYAALASNQQRVPISVQISDASGIKRAALRYTYGDEIGFEDASPEIRGDRYTFHVRPPGIAFFGDVLFAIEGVDGSPNANQAMTQWHKFRMAAFEDQTIADRTLRFMDLGVTFTGATGVAPIRAQMTRVPPVGTTAPAQGQVSTDRYVCFDGGEFQASGVSLAYAPEETWRLIESTLSLAYWDGHKWRRIPSKVDTDAGTVSGAFQLARCWTVIGEDRVLWRAPGRQAGTALTDLNHDGKYEVATTFWQPGQSLSSSGKPLREFPIDPPYHPLQNPSPAIVAALTPGQDPLLLYGAPSGYVYAYDQQGKLHWRTEVGGEIIGGVAVGRMMDGPNSEVAASWDGGVEVIDDAGRVVWKKEVPRPSGSTPVLVDLDGDGKLDIVLNAESEIVALKGDTGAILWKYEVPGAAFVTPAVGQFVRNGKPRVVTGDESGVIYTLDESGKLLWRQDRIFGPRGVPDPLAQYQGISEIGLADLDRRGERQVVAATKSGETVVLSARGERLWWFTSYERKVGTSLARGAHLAFADLEGNGKLDVILSQQDSYLYVLDSKGREKWAYLGYFWYHSSPTIADLQGTGELDIVFTSPETNGTYALRSGFTGKAGRAPWPMDRGGPERANCAAW